MLDSPFTMRGPFPNSARTLAQRFAAIPKLVDTSGGVVFQDTALTPASTDDPVGFALNTAQGAGNSVTLGPNLALGEWVSWQGGAVTSSPGSVSVQNSSSYGGARLRIPSAENTIYRIAGKVEATHYEPQITMLVRDHTPATIWTHALLADGSFDAWVVATGPYFDLVTESPSGTVSWTVSNVEVQEYTSEITGLGPNIADGATFAFDACTGVANGAGFDLTATGEDAGMKIESTGLLDKWCFVRAAWSDNDEGRTVYVSAGGSNVSLGNASSGVVDGEVFLDAGGNTDFRLYWISTSGDTIYMDLTELREIPGTQAVTPNSSARPTLQASGSLRYDGVDDRVTIAAPVGGFPSDCEVFVAVTSDSPSGTKVLALDGETGYIGYGLSGSTDTAINSGVGATTAYFDGAAMTTRGDLYTALLGMGVLNARSTELSAYGELSISGAAARVRGDVGGVVIYDNANGPLTDRQRADIHATLLGGVS